MADEHTDPVTLGKRIRHFRTPPALTLAQLAAATGSTASQLSHIENGRREPRLSLLQSIATTLGSTAAELLESAPPPDRRAALEIELHRAQSSPLFAALGAPAVRPTRSLPIPVLESLVALHRELARRAAEAIATPQEARRANTQTRLAMPAANNYQPETEKPGQEVIRKARDTSAAPTDP